MCKKKMKRICNILSSHIANHMHVLARTLCKSYRSIGQMRYIFTIFLPHKLKIKFIFIMLTHKFISRSYHSLIRPSCHFLAQIASNPIIYTRVQPSRRRERAPSASYVCIHNMYVPRGHWAVLPNRWEHL